MRRLEIWRRQGDGDGEHRIAEEDEALEAEAAIGGGADVR